MHWYDTEGKPRYQVERADGKGMRDTTLRDARKKENQWVPSVTEIIKVANAPALTNWLIQQAYLAMATLPEIEGESVDDRIKRAKRDAKEQANVARDKGVVIHDALECYFKEGKVIEPYGKHIEGVKSTLHSLFGNQEWVAEESFYSPYGYGGKVDLHCREGDGIVVDFKTKEFTEDKLPKAFDNHAEQLSAYRVGLELPKAKMYNLFVSTSVPGLVHAVEVEDKFTQFQHLLQYWKWTKNYFPGE